MLLLLLRLEVLLFGLLLGQLHLDLILEARHDLRPHGRDVLQRQRRVARLVELVYNRLVVLQQVGRAAAAAGWRRHWRRRELAPQLSVQAAATARGLERAQRVGRPATHQGGGLVRMVVELERVRAGSDRVRVVCLVIERLQLMVDPVQH